MNDDRCTHTRITVVRQTETHAHWHTYCIVKKRLPFSVTHYGYTCTLEMNVIASVFCDGLYSLKSDTNCSFNRLRTANVCNYASDRNCPRPAFHAFFRFCFHSLASAVCVAGEESGINIAAVASIHVTHTVLVCECDSTLI